jgi:hypothetical protein
MGKIFNSSVIINNGRANSFIDDNTYNIDISSSQNHKVEANNQKKFKIYRSFKRLNEFLDNFRSFSNNFHSHIYPMVIEFKKDEGKDKDIIAELLINQFKTYKEIAKTLDMYDFIRPSFNMFLLSLEKWEEYYKSFLDYKIPNDKLIIIENEALALETKFWKKVIKLSNSFESLILYKSKINIT